MDLALVYALIAVGLLLLVAELVLPSFGVLTVLSLGCLVGGVVLAFGRGPAAGWLTLAFVVVAVPILLGFMLRYWPETAVGKKFFLSGPTEQAEAIEAQEEKMLEGLVGRTGTTLSPLRPAGVVDFDGRRVDVITEGMMVERGQPVRCIEIRAGKVVVRPLLSQGPGEDQIAADEWNIQ